MTAPSPKELSERLEALRRTLRASGKIGTESAENYELVSILNGVAALEGQNRQTVNEEWMDCPCGCDCVFLGHDGSLVTCPKHQTEGEKRLLRESVEVRSSSTTEPR